MPNALLTMSVPAAGIAGLLLVWRHRPQQRPVLLAVVAAAGLGFQAFHFVEHLVQAVAWTMEPGRAPFLSSLAITGRDALAVGGHTQLGEELLHLMGNAIFLAGLLGFTALVGHHGARAGPSLRLAFAIQAVHVIEHLVLTATVALIGRAVGVTTLFGLLQPGPVLWTVRPAAHLALNAVGTVLAGVAVVHWARSRTGVGQSLNSRTTMVDVPASSDPATVAGHHRGG